MKLLQYKLNKELIYLLLIGLCSVDLFSLNGFVNIGRFIYFGFVLFAIPFIIHFIIYQKGTNFSSTFIWLFCAILLSSICCYFFWNQGFFDSFIALLFSIIGFFFYFDFLHKKISTNSVEKAIIVLGAIYIALFLFSFLIYPKSIFYNPYTDPTNLFQGEEDRGLQRVILNGSGFLFLLYFLSLNKTFTKKNWFWFLLCATSLVCIVLTLTRIYIFAVSVITFFYIVSKFKFVGKLIAAALFVLLFFFIAQLGFVQKIVDNTVEEIETLDNYVRLQEAEYFLGEFQQSTLTYIFGNGFERTSSIVYGKKLVELKQVNNYYISDLGILGLYIYLGIPGVIAIILLVYKGIKLKVPQEFQYLKMFIVFLLLTCFTTFAFYSLDFLISIVFVLYLYEKNSYRINKRMKINLLK